ncbi:MAG: Fe-S cluster assembly protein SufD [candidate division Zixibacteria bacterium]|nr:Fe-S cluster assembly protein SufD [candidate division Zixibacteria bacterium]
MTTTDQDIPGQLATLPDELTSDPDWLADSRKESRKAYNASDLPIRSVHLWRYTDPALFLHSNGSAPVAESNADIPAYTEALSKFSDGSLSALALDNACRTFEIKIAQAAAKNTPVVMTLRQAAIERPDLVQSHLGSLVGAQFGKFEALNMALWSDGIFIYIPKGAKLAEPIHLLRSGSSGEAWSYGRTLIVADEDSEVTLIDEYFSANAAISGKSNNVVELIGLSRSNIHYFAIQRNNLNSLSFYTQRSVLHDSAKTTTVFATLGAKQHKADVGTVMKGRRTESLQYGLVFGSGKQQFDHHTVHINQGANGYSNLDFKVVLKDKAHSAYTGLIRVDKHVQNCEAYQSNRNLLLTRGARAESIPELEILCDEVICTHGATVGPIDEMQLFYLMNRGIPKNEATKILVRGFVEPTLALMPDSLQGQIRRHVDQRLETL